jgi:Ca-activated chloride channel family protein
MMLRVLATAICLISAFGGGEQHRSEQEPILRLEAPLVLLNVTVTGDDGRYVRKLSERDFTILEDGRPQPIAHFSAEETPFAIAILLDVSGSMERTLRIARAAARGFVQGLREHDVFALYAFATRFAQIQPFGSHPDIEPDVWSLKAEGYTALYDCLVSAARDLAERPEKRRALLLLSDGADTASRASLDDALREALAANVTIYAVDLMDEASVSPAEVLRARQALRTLSEQTGGRYIRDPGGAQMYATFQAIVQELGHQYTLGYYPALERRDGRWHRIDVRVARPGVTVRTRRGYYAPRR